MRCQRNEILKEHQITILDIEQILEDYNGNKYKDYIIPPCNRYDCYYLFDGVKCYSELSQGYGIVTIPDKKEIYDNMSMIQNKIYEYLKKEGMKNDSKSLL